MKSYSSIAENTSLSEKKNFLQFYVKKLFYSSDLRKKNWPSIPKELRNYINIQQSSDNSGNHSLWNDVILNFHIWGAN